MPFCLKSSLSSYWVYVLNQYYTCIHIVLILLFGFDCSQESARIQQQLYAVIDEIKELKAVINDLDI